MLLRNFKNGGTFGFGKKSPKGFFFCWEFILFLWLDVSSPALKFATTSVPNLFFELIQASELCSKDFCNSFKNLYFSLFQLKSFLFNVYVPLRVVNMFCRWQANNCVLCLCMLHDVHVCWLDALVQYDWRTPLWTYLG